MVHLQGAVTCFVAVAVIVSPGVKFVPTVCRLCPRDSPSAPIFLMVVILANVPPWAGTPRQQDGLAQAATHPREPR